LPETNPDDINPSTLEAWFELGINRLSIIQSFDDAELKRMNTHDAAKQNLFANRASRFYKLLCI
jgi:coproporphyrinogen III oxidase-like Fe-S oxidoreductase